MTPRPLSLHGQPPRHPCGCTGSTCCPTGDRLWQDVRVYLRDYTPAGDEGYASTVAAYRRHFEIPTP